MKSRKTLISVEYKRRDNMDTMRDPVCGMEVTYETAEARSEYEGQTYYFCSVDCKETFDKNPEKYVHEQQTGR
jgi:YHS domain-containing protein